MTEQEFWQETFLTYAKQNTSAAIAARDADKALDKLRTAFEKPKPKGLASMTMVLAIFGALAFPAAVRAQSAGAGTKYAMPDAKLTPGVINPEIEADPSGAKVYVAQDRALVEVNICAKDFRTKPFRKTTEAEKRAVCREYHAAPGTCPGMKWGEVDHLIPLELGGEDAVANLWWQPAQQYLVKDHGVEDKLPHLVCSGKMTLPEAQECLRSDWVACAARVKKLDAEGDAR